MDTFHCLKSLFTYQKTKKTRFLGGFVVPEINPKSDISWPLSSEIVQSMAISGWEMFLCLKFEIILKGDGWFRRELELLRPTWEEKWDLGGIWPCNKTRIQDADMAWLRPAGCWVLYHKYSGQMIIADTCSTICTFIAPSCFKCLDFIFVIWLEF